MTNIFRITCTFADGRLALATIRLASGPDDDDRPRPDPARSEAAASAVRNILIVEDEMFVAWHIEDMVQSLENYVSTIVASGEEALASLARAPADLVLMDINLGGGLDGIEATKRIAATSDIPIIFITAYSDARTMERIREVAPRAMVLQKPVTAEALRRAVDRALGPRPN